MDAIGIATTGIAPHQIFLPETTHIKNTITTTGNPLIIKEVAKELQDAFKKEPEPDALDEELNIYFGLTKTEPEHEKVIAHVTGVTLQDPGVGAFTIKDNNLPQNFGEASEEYANQWDKTYKAFRYMDQRYHEESCSPLEDMKSTNATSPKYTIWTVLQWAGVLGACATILYYVIA